MTVKLKPMWFLVIPIIIAIDFVSKFWANHHFSYAERLTLIPGFFDLTLVYNPGAAFSFLAGAGEWKKYFFLILAVLVCVYLFYAIITEQFGFKGAIGALFIISGALGNVLDRLLYDHVIDFLLFYYKSFYYPAFNVADSFICVGAFLLIWEGLRSKKQDADSSEEESKG